MLKPTRATAVRRSAILRSEGLSAAEFAMFMSLAASTGSEPTTSTTVSLLALSSESARCRRTTTSGTDGRSTCPCDNSFASAFTKPKVTVFGKRAADRRRDFRGAHVPSAWRSEAISACDSASAAPQARRIEFHAARGRHGEEQHLFHARIGTERGERVAHREHVGEIGGALVLTLLVLGGGDRGDDLLRHVPVAQDGLRDAAVPFGHDALVAGRIGQQRRKAPRARQQVELADAVQQSGQQRGVGVDAGESSWRRRGSPRRRAPSGATARSTAHRVPCTLPRAAAATWRRRSWRCAPC